MKIWATFVLLLISQSCFAQEGGPCDPGPCETIPGLVYNAESNECSWPDEVGCSLQGNFFT